MRIVVTRHDHCLVHDDQVYSSWIDESYMTLLTEYLIKVERREERRIIGTLVKKKLNIPETELSWAVMMMITMAREKPLNLSLSLMVDNYYWIRPPSDISQHLETTDQQTFLYIICLWCNHINECVLWFSLHLCLSQTKGRCQKSFFLIDLKIHKSIPYFWQKK